MRGLKRDRSLRTVAAGHAFIQNVRRGHYELAVDVPVRTAWPSRGRTRRRHLINVQPGRLSLALVADNTTVPFAHTGVAPAL